MQPGSAQVPSARVSAMRPSSGMSPQQVYVGRGEVPRSAAPGRAGAPAIPPGHVQLYCPDPPRNLVLPLGPEPVKVSGGGGGWEVLPRPHQTGATVWTGGEPYLLQVPLMLDNYARGTSVERSIRALERIARGDEETAPGPVEVGGLPLPVDQWVVESMEYGDPIRATDGLAVLRQPLTLTLREFVPPGFVQLRRRRSFGGGYGRGRKTAGFKAKQGETVASFAKRRKVPWTALRELNPGVVVRANQKLKAGQLIYSPPPQKRKPPPEPPRGVLG